MQVTTGRDSSESASPKAARTTEDYLKFISRLKSLDGFILDALQREVLSPNIEWHEPYSEYASPGLQVAVLLSPDGEENNFSWKDCKAPKETPLLARLVTVKQLLAGFGFNIMASRLLRLQPGTFLHEHRDYVYLEEVPRYRLHVPIVTNSQAQIVMPGTTVHMSRGSLWKLNPKEAVHSACNFGLEARIHLMMDCYVNDALADLVTHEALPVDSVKELPVLTADDKARILADGRKLVQDGQQEAAEDLILRQFCYFDLNGETTYQLLYELYGGLTECEQRLEYWRGRAQEVYPVIKH
jgi:hypothetical protein